MAFEANVNVRESSVNFQRMKQQASSETPVPLEQSHCFSSGDVLTGLTTKVVEDKGMVEMPKTFSVMEISSHDIKAEDFKQEAAPILLEPLTDINIPVVDLALSHGNLVAAIGNACQWGFFQVVNHGTSLNLLTKIASQSEEFFDLPAEDKERCTTEAKIAGPIHFGAGSKGDWRDVLKMNCAPESAVAIEHWPLQPVGFSKGMKIWKEKYLNQPNFSRSREIPAGSCNVPDSLSYFYDLRETLMDYATQQQMLVRRLLEIISESLGLEKGYITNECKDPRVLLAINQYPPCPDPTLTIGMREHSDPSTITILLQDEVSGLQMYNEGLWVDVKPLKDALVVNIGDHLQVLTNGRYHSCVHRVINDKWRRRISTALFLSPSRTTYIKPAPSLVDEEHPALYHEFMYGDFLEDFYRNGGANKKVILSTFGKPTKTV